MECPVCSGEVANGAAFCPYCGAPMPRTAGDANPNAERSECPGAPKPPHAVPLPGQGTGSSRQSTQPSPEQAPQQPPRRDDSAQGTATYRTVSTESVKKPAPKRNSTGYIIVASVMLIIMFIFAINVFTHTDGQNSSSTADEAPSANEPDTSSGSVQPEEDSGDTSSGSSTDVPSSGESSDQASDPAGSETPEPANIPDFDVYGKWKNVGDDEYGQMRKNAVVVFDGVNCNVYSPKDTYALESNGDGTYHLTVTGLLGGSPSFTVIPIDQNNMVLENGDSTQIHLKRVQ